MLSPRRAILLATVALVAAALIAPSRQAVSRGSKKAKGPTIDSAPYAEGDYGLPLGEASALDVHQFNGVTFDLPTMDASFPAAFVTRGFIAHLQPEDCYRVSAALWQHIMPATSFRGLCTEHLQVIDAGIVSQWPLESVMSIHQEHLHNLSAACKEKLCKCTGDVGRYLKKVLGKTPRNQKGFTERERATPLRGARLQPSRPFLGRSLPASRRLHSPSASCHS